ncbi:Flp pilus assembly complex ATPase component TadA [Candidatus Gracilibacteria bacterium]|nr:Flp pilus assembly complex ATPase component TadA [Candidatus Gracilibacteria bacterium]
MRGRRNILISGGTGSGKTTLLRAVAAAIDLTQERIVTIEDTAELRIGGGHDNVAGLEARKADRFGEGEMTIRQLVHNALRMRPDRIIVGEVRALKRSICSRRGTPAMLAQWRPYMPTRPKTRGAGWRPWGCGRKGPRSCRYAQFVSSWLPRSTSLFSRNACPMASAKSSVSPRCKGYAMGRSCCATCSNFSKAWTPAARMSALSPPPARNRTVCRRSSRMSGRSTSSSSRPACAIC